MKQILALLAFGLWAVAAWAQKPEGHIVYETKINLHRRIPAEQEAMKAQIPEFRTFKTELFFNGNESFHKLIEEEEEDEDMGGGGMRMRFRMPTSETYYNFGTQMKTEQRDIMGKKILIQDTLRAPAWKLTDETKEIKGYQCKKATSYNAERKTNITAWYTESIMASVGPENYHSLPGAVLMIDVNDGEITVSPLEVNLRALKKGELRIPSEGQKMTDAEFRKMMEERMKQMGGPGMRIIRN